MKTWIKRTLLAGAAVGLAGGALLFGALQAAERKMSRRIAVTVQPLQPRPDTANAAQIEQGRYLFATRGCADCHGKMGAGKTVINTDGLLVISPNLTSGENSVTSRYSEADWVRAVRHGVKPDGRPLMIMPSEDYSRLSDADLSALISYIVALTPVHGTSATLQLGLPIRVLYGLGQINDAASKIDHSLQPQTPVPVAETLQHGAYVAATCVGCHGPGLSGGRIPGGPPHWPAAANLTKGKDSALARYSDAAQFEQMMRSGMRPDGSKISTVMPFSSFSQMRQVDLRAMYLYLQSLPPRDAGQR
jgi:mono/diheme cytochrome c family protein